MTTKILGIIVLCLVLMCEASFAATDAPKETTGPSLPLSGRLFADVFAPARQVDSAPFRQTSTSLWLQGEPKFNEKSSAHFTLTGDAFDTSVTQTSSYFRSGLREGYVDYQDKGFDLRFGKQILPWGKSDVVNPTDFLSAKDYTFLNPDDETRRLGATSLWMSLTPNQGNSPWNVIAVWTPVFPQTSLLIAPSSIPAGLTVTTTQTPVFTLPNSETALKLSYLGSSWDASVSVFRGWGHTAQFGLVSLSPSPVVTSTFDRNRGVGTDFSLSTGGYIYRLESAFVFTNNDGTNALTVPTHWDTVAGVEHPIGDDFRVQVQFIYRYFPTYTSPSDSVGANAIMTGVDIQIAQANALLLNYQDKVRPAGTFRLSYTNDKSGWEAETFVLGNFVGGDFLFRPKISYALSDALKGTLGSDYYGGATSRPLGALKVYNDVFAEAKYSF